MTYKMLNKCIIITLHLVNRIQWVAWVTWIQKQNFKISSYWKRNIQLSCVNIIIFIWKYVFVGKFFFLIRSKILDCFWFNVNFLLECHLIVMGAFDDCKFDSWYFLATLRIFLRPCGDKCSSVNKGYFCLTFFFHTVFQILDNNTKISNIQNFIFNA